MVRYFTYIVPVALVLLIPLLVTAIRFPDHTTGGVYTKWVMIWLEVVWLGLWAGRVSNPASRLDIPELIAKTDRVQTYPIPGGDSRQCFHQRQ